MKKIYLFAICILLSSLSFASEDSLKYIKIQSSVVGWYKPDFAVISVTIQEYMLPDANAQSCTPVSLSEIREKLLKELKPFHVKETDLEMNGMTEVYQNNYNNFGYPNNANMQPTLLSKVYEFKIINDESVITPLFEALNIKGIKVSGIFGEYSEETENRIKTEMLKKCSATSLERVTLLSEMNQFSVEELLTIEVSDEGTTTNTPVTNIYLEQYHTIGIKPAKHTMYATFTYSIK